MPISMFQIASATSDGIHFAICIMIMSIFITMHTSGYNAKLLTLMSIFIFILATHRINFYVMSLLPGFLFFKYREKNFLFASAIIVFATTAWILYTMGSHSSSSPRSLSNVIIYYLLNPTETISIFYNTFTKCSLLKFYYTSFIGRLGWLDYSVKGTIHIIFAFLCFAFVNYSNFRQLDTTKKMSLLCAFFIFISTYFILLVQWTKFPGAEFIEGVQGRYFITIVIMVSYLFIHPYMQKFNNNLLRLLIFIFSTCSFISLIKYSILRYYIG